MVHGTPGLFPIRCSPTRSSVGVETGRRTEKEVRPVCTSRRLQSPTDPTPAPNSKNRRDYHVVSP
jgi:hypothetical protein